MAESQGPPALHLDDVHFGYPARRQRPSHHALRGVSLEIAEGEAVALLGPNGSGKSTLLKIISGLLVPDRGHVTAFGERDRMARRRRLGVVFQREALDEQMTVTENLLAQAALYGLSAGEAAGRIDACLDASGLAEHRLAPVGTLSGGTRRRIDLCRALLHEPSLLILDEPTTGLDPSAREAFLDGLDERRRDTALAVLMSTHLVDEAQRHHRVVLLHRGLVVADDDPVAMRRRLGDRRVTVLDRRWEPPAADRDRWAETSRGWSRGVDETLGLDAIAAAGLAFTVAPPTLADVFEHLTGARWDQEADPERETVP